MGPKKRENYKTALEKSPKNSRKRVKHGGEERYKLFSLRPEVIRKGSKKKKPMGPMWKRFFQRYAKNLKKRRPERSSNPPAEWNIIHDIRKRKIKSWATVPERDRWPLTFRKGIGITKEENETHRGKNKEKKKTKTDTTQLKHGLRF